MHRLTERKILLVVRTTRLADLKARFATKMQAKFYVSSLGGDFSDYEREDATYEGAIVRTKQVLAALGRVQVVPRALLPNLVLGPEDVVVVLGQDGLVANTLKYLNGQPLLGVNPDPKRWDGQLLPFKVNDLDSVMREVLLGKRKTRAVTMAQVELNTGPRLLAVNDFFIGAKTHVSARYRIQHGDQSETQSSSGVIVSTGLGSTGWLKSLLTGAAAITQAAGSALARQAVAAELPLGLDTRGRGRRLNLTVKTEFPWDSAYLCFTVREPFPSRTTGASLVFGRVTPDQPLIVESLMGEHGVIFSDGIEQDFLEFTSGTRAVVTLAERKGVLVE